MISEQRKKLKLSQSQLAVKSNINVRTLQHYEQGSKNINHAKLSTLLALATALDCKLTDVLTDPELIKQYEEFTKKH